MPIMKAIGFRTVSDALCPWNPHREAIRRRIVISASAFLLSVKVVVEGTSISWTVLGAWSANARILSNGGPGWKHVGRAIFVALDPSNIYLNLAFLEYGSANALLFTISIEVVWKGAGRTVLGAFQIWSKRGFFSKTVSDSMAFMVRKITDADSDIIERKESPRAFGTMVGGCRVKWIGTHGRRDS